MKKERMKFIRRLPESLSHKMENSNDSKFETQSLEQTTLLRTYAQKPHSLKIENRNSLSKQSRVAIRALKILNFNEKQKARSGK